MVTHNLLHGAYYGSLVIRFKRPLKTGRFYFAQDETLVLNDRCDNRLAAVQANQDLVYAGEHIPGDSYTFVVHYPSPTAELLGKFEAKYVAAMVNFPQYAAEVIADLEAALRGETVRGVKCGDIGVDREWCEHTLQIYRHRLAVYEAREAERSANA